MLTQRKIELLKPRGARYKVSDDRVTGLFVRVEPTGRKSFYVYYRVNGRASQVKLASTQIMTLSDAREVASGVLLKARLGVSEAKERRAALSQTLGGFLEVHYKPWVMANHSRPDAIQILENTFKAWHTKPLTDITMMEVDRWRSQQTLATSTVNGYVRKLKTALNKAVEWDIIEKNPLERLRKLKEPEVVIRWLTEGEEKRLLDALSERDQARALERTSYNNWLKDRGQSPKPTPEEYETNISDHLTPLVIIALRTGMRRSELLRLRWAEVLLSKDDVTGTESDVPMITVQSGKTGKVRYIPLNDEASQTLREWKRFSTALVGKTPEHVFVNGRGQPLNSVKTSWRNLTLKANVNVGFHTLRRTFGSRLVQKGISIYQVSKLLGHSTVTTTEQHYAALNQQDALTAVRTLGESL